MKDTISILSELRSNYNCFDSVDEPYYQALTEAIAAIKAERKGHWINRNGNNIYPFWERYKCSVCGGNSNNSDYCPSCGARMEIEE